MSVEIKQHTASTFLIKMSTSEGFVSKPKIYELDYVLNSQSPEKTLIICKSVETGQYLFKETIENIKVDGASFQDVESLTSELAPLVFSVGGGSGSGASNSEDNSNPDDEEEEPQEEPITFRKVMKNGNYMPGPVSFYIGDENKDKIDDETFNEGSDRALFGYDTNSYTWYMGTLSKNIAPQSINFFLGVDSGGGVGNKAFYNTGVGGWTLYNLKDGRNNNAFGMESMYALERGSDNFAGGSSSLVGLVEGSWNTSIGTAAGFTLQKGNNNVFIGKSAGADVISANNSLFLGNFAGYGVKSNRVPLKRFMDRTPILQFLIDDWNEWFVERFDYNTKDNTIISSNNNFIGSDAYKQGPAATIFSTILGSETCAYFSGFHNNIVISNLIYGVQGSTLYNSIIVGNFMRAETKDNVLAVHMAKSELVPFSQSLIYGEFDTRRMTINGTFILPPKYSPAVNNTFNQVLVRNSKGEITGKPISELIPTLDKETLLNFIRENKEEVLSILLADVKSAKINMLKLIGVREGIYYKKNNGDEQFTEDLEFELSQGDVVEITRSENEFVYISDRGSFGKGKTLVVSYDDLENFSEVHFERFSIVEKLVGDGVATIDTGVKITNEMELFTAFSISNDFDTNKIVSGIWDEQGNKGRYQLLLSKSNGGFTSRLQFGVANENLGFVPNKGQKYTYNINYNSAIIDFNTENRVDYRLSSRMSTPFETVGNAFVFGNGANKQGIFNGEIYEFAIINRTTREDVIRLIPAQRDRDNKLGMFDIVSGQFFTSEEGNFSLN